MGAGVLRPVERALFEALCGAPALEAALLRRGGQPQVGDCIALVRRSDRSGQVVGTGLLGPVDGALLELLSLGARDALDAVFLAESLAELVLLGIFFDRGLRLRLLGLLVVVLLVVLAVAGLFAGLQNRVDRRAHLAHLGVEGVTRAVGLSEVAVSDQVRLRRFGDSVDRELPGDRRGDGIACLLRRGRAVVGTQHGDAEGSGVVSGDVSADNGLRDVTAASVPEAAVLVCDDVVSDVVPTAALLVVGLDTADDSGNIGSRVAVRAGGVVNDGLLDAAGVVGAAAVGLGTPRAARADLRLRHLLRHGVHRRRSGYVVLVGHRRTGCGIDILSSCRLGVSRVFGRLRRCGFGTGGVAAGLAGKLDRIVLGDGLSVSGALLRIDEHEFGLARCGITEDAHLNSGGVRHRHRLRTLVLGLFLLLFVQSVPIAPFRSLLGADLDADIGLRFGEREADETRVVVRNVEDIGDESDIHSVFGLLTDRTGDVVSVLSLRLLGRILRTLVPGIVGLLVLRLRGLVLCAFGGSLLGWSRPLGRCGLVGTGGQSGGDVVDRTRRRRCGGLDDIGHLGRGQGRLRLEDIRQIARGALVGGSGVGITGIAGTGDLESLFADVQRLFGYIGRRRGCGSRRCRDQ